ncbi:MAG: fibronectin type III domain-containing protein [Gemmatimonadota bacterium]|nr:fibronectin type III domain-containing protein [Gemmatimonadota bacterium]
MLRLAPFALLAVALIACDRDTPTKPIASAPAGKMVATVDAPAEPTNLRVEAITDTSARVAWDAVEGATDYDVNYRTLSGRWTNEPHKGTRLYNTIYDLEPNTEYRWAVRAENSDGPSDWVFAENFTTLGATESSVTSANLELGGSVEGDRAALEAIWEALNLGEEYRGWMTRLRIGKWACVETNAAGRVTSLTLPCRADMRKPEGILPPEIGQLDHLKHLEITGYVGGSLPAEWGRLSQLEHLVIEIYLHHEVERQLPLVEGIPDEWRNLRNLRVLYTGLLGPQIPDWIGELKSLEILDWPSGPKSIPPQIGQLTNLRILRLPSIKGEIPAEFGNLSNLDSLLISSTSSSSIPPEFGNLTNLRHLTLRGFGGTLPRELSNLTQLVWLGLDNGKFSGGLPPDWGKLTKLELLWIGDAELEGELPSEWASMTSLTDLYLAGNLLEGQLPDSWAFLQNLKQIRLNDNYFEGELPAFWSHMDSLEVLDLSQNSFEGHLPSSWGDLQNLRKLNLRGNYLVGTIPEAWGQMKSLESISLNNNNMGGQLPSFLTSWNSSAWPLIRGIGIANGSNSTWEGYHPVNMCFDPEAFSTRIREAIDLYFCRPPSNRSGSGYMLGG